MIDPPGEAEFSFTRADLLAMPQVEYRTSTIWTDTVHAFTGVPLSELLKVAGISEGTLLLSASNDYAVELPVSTVAPDAPIIAMNIDGVPMNLRDKGPLWVVYPYDRSTEFQTEVIYTRSVWQLVRIEVLP